VREACINGGLVKDPEAFIKNAGVWIPELHMGNRES
jgi:hypothetical protein